MKATIFVLLSIITPALSHAADLILVRGKLVKIGGGATKPAPGYKVTMLNSSERTPGSTSDPDGMYGIYVTPGKYILEVWTKYNDPTSEPTRYQVDIESSARGYQDLPPIEIK